MTSALWTERLQHVTSSPPNRDGPAFKSVVYAFSSDKVMKELYKNPWGSVRIGKVSGQWTYETMHTLVSHRARLHGQHTLLLTLSPSSFMRSHVPVCVCVCACVMCSQLMEDLDSLAGTNSSQISTTTSASLCLNSPCTLAVLSSSYAVGLYLCCASMVPGHTCTLRMVTILFCSCTTCVLTHSIHLTYVAHAPCRFHRVSALLQTGSSDTLVSNRLSGRGVVKKSDPHHAHDTHHTTQLLYRPLCPDGFTFRILAGF